MTKNNVIAIATVVAAIPLSVAGVIVSNRTEPATVVPVAAPVRALRSDLPVEEALEPTRTQRMGEEEMMREHARQRQRELVEKMEALNAEAADARCEGKLRGCIKRVPSLRGIESDIERWNKEHGRIEAP